MRLNDNVGLHHSLSSGFPVLPIFIFDTDILNQLGDSYDRRADYIHQALTAIHTRLLQHRSTLYTYHGAPLDVFKEIVQNHTIKAVYCNRDYEPKAIKRDSAVQAYLQENSIAFYDFKDQVIFDRFEIVKSDRQPYTVFTPYANKWKKELTNANYAPVPVSFSNFYPSEATAIHSHTAIGFQKTDMAFQQPELDIAVIKNYHQYRDFPAYSHTTKSGTALRFGTISIRRCVAFALQHNETWLSELIWREFFMQILFHFPHVVSNCFKPHYESIAWQNNEVAFQRWCDGATGYPLVDAGMRQLNETGFMHNRVRMVTASFLCKHLLIDWRWGEAYFAQKLVDYELSSNNGNWQWAAGCGCDAAPYFRIFNPTAQTLKFDKDLQYIKRWNPNYEQAANAPIVQHEMARKRALEVYRKALQETKT
ncbi:MAG: deoxyribodipyrimidine photo-lyase [Parapedobacter sp.]|nr:MAG: deoxyribodipyrimidine photo-lyase [Parapedobacter sp.]